MNTRTSLIRMSTFAALIGCALAGSHVAAQEAAVSIEDRAPLQATLLPTVSVVADATRPDAQPSWSIAATRPQRVTLMPTLRISAQAEPLAVTLMPTITVTAKAESLAAVSQPEVDAYAIARADTARATRAPLRSVARTLPASRPDVDDTNAGATSGRNLQVVPR